MDTPKIIPPGDEQLRLRLQKKLEEYKRRKAGKGGDWEYMHPELAHKFFGDYRDACYKIDVLEAVLKARQPVDTQEFSLELAKKYGDDFDVPRFCIACGVVAYYCGCGGEEKPTGGTGLPPV